MAFLPEKNGTTPASESHFLSDGQDKTDHQIQAKHQLDRAVNLLRLASHQFEMADDKLSSLYATSIAKLIGDSNKQSLNPMSEAEQEAYLAFYNSHNPAYLFAPAKESLKVGGSGPAKESIDSGSTHDEPFFKMEVRMPPTVPYAVAGTTYEGDPHATREEIALLGKIVWFRLYSGNRKGELCPAIIERVRSMNEVDLQLFHHGQSDDDFPAWLTHVWRGVGLGTWREPHAHSSDRRTTHKPL